MECERTKRSRRRWRSSLAIHNHDQRRRWYLDTEADDQRATDALTAAEQR